VHHADRWAAAFIGVLDSKAEEGLVFLKETSALLKPFSGFLFGRSSAAFIEKNLCELFSVQSDTTSEKEKIYPIRFICLLIEKKLFRNIDSIIEKIDALLDDKNGVLHVAVETASSEDAQFGNELEKMISASTGAAKIKLCMNVVPELLAGYRLRMGGQYIDASLKGQLEQMTDELIRA
jgi:ATP synthase F1 delta subunit